MCRGPAGPTNANRIRSQQGKSVPEFLADEADARYPQRVHW
jgi:hypothetical protein